MFKANCLKANFNYGEKTPISIGSQKKTVHIQYTLYTHKEST